MEDNQIGRKDGWISVKDRMPKEGVPVLIFVYTHGERDHGWMNVSSFLKGKWSPVGEGCQVDFWKELPAKPNFEEYEKRRQSDNRRTKWV